jgi:hypothetical protein
VTLVCPVSVVVTVAVSLVVTVVVGWVVVDVVVVGVVVDVTLVSTSGPHPIKKNRLTSAQFVMEHLVMRVLGFWTSIAGVEALMGDKHRHVHLRKGYNSV